ncbi:hypothetical protein [Methylobacterium planeticum]|uniref:Uncharacterized protein n=1 Tax=Methylobacterium planeticum TaxID=2615211 RepID=A0A6N6MT10_9HYPH|nr:hypothetical protein [Methylobacterium planeticum]KAB1073665.1 hypothetical protein F6X51_10760 [Methylobacterium planeticum]
MLCDPNQRESAILAISPRDAMPDGGRMRIETRNIEAGASAAARNPGSTRPPHRHRGERHRIRHAAGHARPGDRSVHHRVRRNRCLREWPPRPQGMPMIAQPFSAEALATRIRQTTEM